MKVGLLLGGGLGLLGGAAVYKDEGMRRSAIFWGNVLPIYSHYRYTEWSLQGLDPHTQQQRYQYLHDKYAHKVESLTLRLKGFYTKAAQLISTRDEILPQQYASWCKKLQDQVPSEIKYEDLIQIIEKELGKPVHLVFKHIEANPIGAASIGVVHKAILCSGEQVVIKVQYPGIESRFRSDIQTLKRFCSFAMPHHLPGLREVEKQFVHEFDYQKEARHLLEVGENLKKSDWKSKVIVPKPFINLCTKSVLVMEYLPGKKLIDGLKEQFSVYAQKQGKTLEGLEEEQKLAIKEGRMRWQSLRSFSRKVTWYNKLNLFFVSVHNFFSYIYNVSFGRITKLFIPYKYATPIINLGEILETLLKVHGYEIFIDGLFNGDPHPGNILLLPDGRLGLIDYGQTKKLSIENRRLYAKLIIALAEDKRDEVVRIVTEDMGIQTKYNNPDVLYRFAAFWNDRDSDDILLDMNIQLFMEYLERIDPIVSVNEEYIICGRVSFLLRALGNAFGMKTKVSQYWKPYAMRAMKMY
jgi:aarF domain-containing kinase